MLRINSLLYIEKLWSSPIIEEVQEEEQVVTDYRSVDVIQEIITKEIREELDQESLEAYDLDPEVIEVYVPELTVQVNEEQDILVEIEDVLSEDTPDKQEEEDKIENVQDEAEVENVLKIDTNIASDASVAAVLVESPSEEIAHNQSTISSSSSIPVITPTSSQSTTPDYPKPEQVVTPRPRKKTLLRRETEKFNEKRKSLTKKLRRALTADLK